MRPLNAKLIIEEEETLESVKKQRDHYKQILDMIQKEVIDDYKKDKYKGDCNLDDIIYYLEYLLEEKENENEK